MKATAFLRSSIQTVNASVIGWVDIVHCGATCRGEPVFDLFQNGHRVVSSATLSRVRLAKRRPRSREMKLAIETQFLPELQKFGSWWRFIFGDAHPSRRFVLGPATDNQLAGCRADAGASPQRAGASGDRADHGSAVLHGGSADTDGIATRTDDMAASSRPVAGASSSATQLKERPKSRPAGRVLF